MQTLISENIYEEVNVTDYQGVCTINMNDGNPANILQTVILLATFCSRVVATQWSYKCFVIILQPFIYILKLIKWTIKVIAWAIIQTSLLPVDANDLGGAEYDSGK